MTYAEMEFVATVVIQLVVSGFAFGRLWQISKIHTDILRSYGKKLDSHEHKLYEHEGKISALEAKVNG